MTKLLLVSLQIEYETTDITIDDLCLKHNVDLRDLRDYETWHKPPELQQPIAIEEPIVIEELIEEPVEVKRIKGLLGTKDPAQQPVVPKNPEPPVIVSKDIKDKVIEFKELAMEEALRFIRKDVKFAEIKEFKDMVAIVDSIDKSLQKPTSSAPTINILVQNLAERYRDDC